MSSAVENIDSVQNILKKDKKDVIAFLKDAMCFQSIMNDLSARQTCNKNPIIKVMDSSGDLQCYDVIVYSLDKSLALLIRALTETKRIQWQRKLIFPSIRMEFKESLSILKNEMTHPFLWDVPSYIWWQPKEKSLLCKYSIPPEYCVVALKLTDATTLNNNWPHKHPGSERYIAKLIEINGGIGLISKQSGQLCAWVLKSYFGALGILQVSPEYRRNGLGLLITQIYSKKLAEDCLDAIGCVVIDNVISQNMFRKLGFEKIIAVTWLLDF